MFFHDKKKFWVLRKPNQSASTNFSIVRVLALPLQNGQSREADGWRLALLTLYISKTFCQSKEVLFSQIKSPNQYQFCLLVAVIVSDSVICWFHFCMTFSLLVFIHIICFQCLPEAVTTLPEVDWISSLVCTHDSHALRDYEHTLSPSLSYFLTHPRLFYSLNDVFLT